MAFLDASSLSVEDLSMVPLSPDVHCEETSLSASSCSLQVFPLVPPLLDGGSPGTSPNENPHSTCEPMDSCPSQDEHYETSLSVSRLSLQVLPLVACSWDDESHSTEPYGKSHAIEAHNAPQDTDVDKNASVNEEIVPEGETSTFKAKTNAQVSDNCDQESIQPHTKYVHILFIGLWVLIVEETEAFHLF